MVKKLFCLFVVMLAVLLCVTPIHAERLPIDVKPIFPKNQDPEIKNYFSLGTKETHVRENIEFSLSNRSNEKVTIQIEALNALNSPQKGIQYTANMEESNSRLLDEQYALATYIDIEEQIVLAGGETKTIPVKIEIPQFDGTILGAIGFKTLDGDEDKADEQVMIRNELNRIIGVQINKETDEKAEFAVHDPYIEPMNAYYVIRLPIEWNASLLAMDVLLEYEVSDEKGNQVFSSGETTPFNMAPKTETEFALPWLADTLEENKQYEITGTLKYGDETLPFNKVFEYNEAMMMKQGEGKEIGRPEIIKDSSFNGWQVLIILLVILGGGILFIRKNGSMVAEKENE